ncbi:kappa-carrageenase [Rhodopirellula maiorica SM1]|uniref:Kappa-carrageenase n=1 Tax=Rhodopirellula maiorica SM1 TaxID=1265738 RepID=M5R8J4_9BACT|nr:kappa-carrageenase [Rhodopirellula maiorica]EMI15793.1 kappa-carrageenase [Rhodopirellula maiorica SM1]
MKSVLIRIAFVLLILMIAPSVALAIPPSPVGDVFAANPEDWAFASEFSDEFNGDQLDTQKWNIDTEDWGTWSWEPENAFLKDGSLQLQMVQEYHQRGNTKLAYTSGIARTRNRMTYGYFEARVKGCARFPGASPAFWLHSKGLENRYVAKDGETVAYSEIDIIELQQGEWNANTKKDNGVDIIDCNLHNVLIKNGQRQWMRPNTHPATNKNEYHASFDPRDDYHVYAVENNQDYVVWYIDGREVARKPNLYWHLPMHVTLSLGLRRPFENYVDGQRVAALDKTTEEGFPTTMSVDYVRVWRNTSLTQSQSAPAKQLGSPIKKRAGVAVKQTHKKDGENLDMSKEEFIAMEKSKWQQNGWPWNLTKVEANFVEIDTNGDGIASGLERQTWFAKKKAEKK